MKSKRSLKSSASIVLSLSVIFTSICGCTFSTEHTYLAEDIPYAIKDICKEEYDVDIQTRLAGNTLWVFMPLEDLFTEAKNPKNSIERFQVKENQVSFNDWIIESTFLIEPVPEKEKRQQIEYSEDASEKMNAVWKVLRRVAFSTEAFTDEGPTFFCMVSADIKNGFLIKDLFYYEDLKKLSHTFISPTEFQHRNVQEIEASPEIIADISGSSINYQTTDFNNFISLQIKQRIRLKFEKPEVEATADIDSEIIKVIAYTLKTYKVKDFSYVELNNLRTQNRIILNRSAVLEGSIEEL